MIKVFQLIRSIHLGGAEIVAFNLAEFCGKDSGNEFEFIIVELHQTHDSYSIEKKKELLLKGIRIISLGNHSKTLSLLIAPFVLAYQLLKEKPQVVHSHTDLPDLLLSNTIRLFSVFNFQFPKIVRTIHNTELWSSHKKLGKYVESAIVGDTIVGVSKAALDAYVKLRGVYNLPISPIQQLVYNGCTTPIKADYQFKINPHKINIGFCGRFEHQKGIDILIQRIKIIFKKFPNIFLFHLVGNGTFLEEILALKNENLIVYESVPNLADKLYAFDYIIMPSRYEGLGLVSIEASFSGVPVIASNVLGLNETLPVNWPLKFQLDDVEELMLIIEKIKNKEFDLGVLKNTAYSYVYDKFSLSSMISSYTKLYLEINK